MDITRVVYGYTTLPEELIIPGGCADTAVPIDLAFFLLRTGGHTVLVDAGCDDMAGFVLRDFIGPVEALRRLGVAPEDVTDVIITHAHEDHMAGVCHFPGAHVYVQRQEYERGRRYLAQGQTVTCFDDELTPFPGVRIVKIGGHSIGSCVVELEGRTVLCGDEVYSRRNLTELIPPGRPRCPDKSRAFLAAYARGWACLLCHEP